MNITDAHLNGILAWRKNTNDVNHYLYYVHNHAGKYILYGTDDPQKTYLALARWYESVDWRRPKSEEFVKGSASYIERRTEGKDQDPRVSNYWIDFREVTSVTGGGTKKDPQQLAFTRKDQSKKFMPDREDARRDFIKDYEASHYGLSNTEEAQWAKGALKNSGSVQDIWKIDDTKFYGHMQSYAVRPACKFLVYESIEARQTVVYCLDDMNLEAVAKKQWAFKAKHSTDVTWLSEADAKRKDGDLNKVPICTSEIRELFRCWDFFGTPYGDGRKKVVFMKDFKSTTAPWESGHQEEWAAYAKHLKDKMANPKSGVPADLLASKAEDMKKVEDKFKSCPSEAIAAYHRCGFGKLKIGARKLNTTSI